MDAVWAWAIKPEHAITLLVLVVWPAVMAWLSRFFGKKEDVVLLDERVTLAEAQLLKVPNAADLQDLRLRLGGVEERLGTLPTASSVQDLRHKIANLDMKVAHVDQQVGQARELQKVTSDNLREGQTEMKVTLRRIEDYLLNHSEAVRK